MFEVIIFIGLPGSGKSAYYKNTYLDTHIRINLDMLHTRTKESKLFDVCINGKISCVIDNTNIKIKEREKYIIKKTKESKIIGVYFDTPTNICLERKPNLKIAIYSKLKEFEYPTLKEGFDEIMVIHT